MRARARINFKLLGLGHVACFAVACAAAQPAPAVAGHVPCAGGSVQGEAGLEVYRHCDEVLGDLKIRDVCSVSTLAGLRKVSGMLAISHSRGLDSLQGLEQLREVSALELRNNALLNDISQVSELRRARDVVMRITRGYVI